MSGSNTLARQGETGSILRSDLLVCDWSAMALEYGMGLEKPVLFIDVPRRIRNPNWQELGIEAIENSMREQLGEIVRPDALEERRPRSNACWPTRNVSGKKCRNCVKRLCSASATACRTARPRSPAWRINSAVSGVRVNMARWIITLLLCFGALSSAHAAEMSQSDSIDIETRSCAWVSVNRVSWKPPLPVFRLCG